MSETESLEPKRPMNFCPANKSCLNMAYVGWSVYTIAVLLRDALNVEPHLGLFYRMKIQVYFLRPFCKKFAELFRDAAIVNYSSRAAKAQALVRDARGSLAS